MRRPALKVLYGATAASLVKVSNGMAAARRIKVSRGLAADRVIGVPAGWPCRAAAALAAPEVTSIWVVLRGAVAAEVPLLLKQDPGHWF